MPEYGARKFLQASFPACIIAHSFGKCFIFLLKYGKMKENFYRKRYNAEENCRRGVKRRRRQLRRGASFEGAGVPRDRVVHEKLGIPVFDIDAIEVLLDWRT